MNKPDLKIIIEQLPEPKRTLSAQWVGEVYVWSRTNVPRSLDLNKFPHIWIVPVRVNWDKVHQWCSEHLGPVDEDWTWTHTDSVRSVDESTLHQLNLIF